MIDPIHNLYLGMAKHLFQNKKINSIKTLFDVHLAFADFIKQWELLIIEIHQENPLSRVPLITGSFIAKITIFNGTLVLKR